eukprot:TRINITY_DN7914_c0_g1_i2.p1 TRINITY_DN7914_c0_g1~~TRINITY_DN7914_c0_g1_i2.p1  ORF type:complete len:170 (+),score=26.21 TRINITY_DN7914_c0_g1_i2:198-707(+)
MGGALSACLRASREGGGESGSKHELLSRESLEGPTPPVPEFTAIFQEPARVYEYDEEEGSFIDRGSGRFQVLTRVQGSSRLYMWAAGRRKVACDMLVQHCGPVRAHQHNAKAVVWTGAEEFTLDGSEQKRVAKATLCVQFQHEDAAKAFAAAFLRAGGKPTDNVRASEP